MINAASSGAPTRRPTACCRKSAGRTTLVARLVAGGTTGTDREMPMCWAQHSSCRPGGKAGATGCPTIRSPSARDFEGVVYLNTEVPYRGLSLECQRSSWKILGAPVDQRRLGPAHRVRSILDAINTQFIDPAPEDVRTGACPDAVTRAAGWGTGSPRASVRSS